MGSRGARRLERSLYASRRQSPPSWITIFLRLGQWLTRKAAELVTTSEAILGNVKTTLLFVGGDVNAAVKMSMLRLIMLSSSVDTFGKELMQSKRARASVEEV